MACSITSPCCSFNCLLSISGAWWQGTPVFHWTSTGAVQTFPVLGAPTLLTFLHVLLSGTRHWFAYLANHKEIYINGYVLGAKQNPGKSLQSSLCQKVLWGTHEWGSEEPHNIWHVPRKGMSSFAFEIPMTHVLSRHLAYHFISWDIHL